MEREAQVASVQLLAAHKRMEEMAEILRSVRHEMDLDPERELQYLKRDAREARVRRGEPLDDRRRDVRRYAALSSDGSSVGYVAGRFGDKIPDVDLSDGSVGAFVNLVVIDPEQRGKHYAAEATRAFARLAQAAGATHIGLKLDQTPPVEPRQKAFGRAGFDVAQRTPFLSIAELLQDRARPVANA